jgi:hypothetical protein
MTRDSWRDAFGDETHTDLEAQVPDQLAQQVWPRLAAELVGRPSGRRRPGWWTVGLAAALALMMTVAGWLVAENRQLRRRPLETMRVEVAAPASSRTVTAGELVARLSLLPPETEVLSAGEAAGLLRRDRPLLYAFLRGPELDALVKDGLTAAEAVAVLRRLDQKTPVNLGGVEPRPARTRS